MQNKDTKIEAEAEGVVENRKYKHRRHVVKSVSGSLIHLILAII